MHFLLSQVRSPEDIGKPSHAHSFRKHADWLLRDDLTVEVIFFGNGEKSGDVVVNKDASATSDTKPKL